jgi:hypothetical protein
MSKKFHSGLHMILKCRDTKLWPGASQCLQPGTSQCLQPPTLKGRANKINNSDQQFQQQKQQQHLQHQEKQQ